MHEFEVRAHAIALVRAGWPVRSAARHLDVAESNVRRWLETVDRREMAHKKTLDQRADELAAEIVVLQDQVRLALLRRMIALSADAGLRDVSVAYGVVTDKQYRASGTALSRATETDDLFRLTDAELDRAWEALAAPLSDEPNSHG